MILRGDVLVLTYEDVTEGLLNAALLTIPTGARKLMIKLDAVKRLNSALGFDDDEESEEPSHV